MTRELVATLDPGDAAPRSASALVVWMGELGRTPRVNPRGGRDDFPSVRSAVARAAAFPEVGWWRHGRHG